MIISVTVLSSFNPAKPHLQFVFSSLAYNSNLIIRLKQAYSSRKLEFINGDEFSEYNKAEIVDLLAFKNSVNQFECLNE